MKQFACSRQTAGVERMSADYDWDYITSNVRVTELITADITDYATRTTVQHSHDIPQKVAANNQLLHADMNRLKSFFPGNRQEFYRETLTKLITEFSNQVQEAHCHAKIYR